MVVEFKFPPIGNKIKEHVLRHKRVYLLGSYITVAGITYAIMRGRHAALLSGADGPLLVTVRPLSFLSKTGDVVTTVYSGGRGHPGFRVRNLEHMLDFDTQGSAARAFKIPESILSSHLNGKFDNALGYHFERIVA